MRFLFLSDPCLTFLKFALRLAKSKQLMEYGGNPRLSGY